MVEITCIHIWSLTAISTFSLLSNQLPSIVTFFAPQNSVAVLLHYICPCCASPTSVTVVTDVPPTCLNSLHNFLTGNTFILPSPNSPVNWHWIFVEETFHLQRSNCTKTSSRDQVFRLLTLHINWLAELYRNCTTNFLSDKVFSVVTTGHLRVGWWPTLALCVAHFWY